MDEQIKLSLQVQVLSDSLPINAGPVFSQPLISATNYSLTYVIPSSLSPGVYRTLLNAPKVWFVQGDLTKTASQGGWIGVYGTSLLIPNDPTSLPPSANLVSVANATVSFNLGVSLQKRGNAWVQYFEVPAYIPVGEYFLSVHNGAGGPTAWVQYRSEIGPQILNTIVVQASPYSLWPSTVFDVTKSTGRNPLLSYWKLLLQSPFTLPPNTILRGDGTDKTFFSYNSTSYGSFITGTVFGVENVTLSATITNPKNSCGCILISKSKTKSDVSWCNAFLQCSGYNHQISIDQSERMVIENVKFDDCDNCVGITGNSNYTRITNGNMTFRTQNVVIRCGMNHVTENLERLYLGDHVANGFGATAGVQPGFLIGDTSKGQKGVWNDDTVADGKEGGTMEVSLVSLEM
ncbi:hypothetical protein BCR33DRAFT_785562 [Rhizoclosmatium globosum]|uniref:Pectin lyase-like protein n=1 Tax=Rhizoclosmatium globosum TaxID=329046 RepID=A0A1Y2C9N9_9FUNG|nr:hypothetical protein BCR33DRAFT_785562 [Rhizoclosmatium globosum]|eukprot:ORY43739.1 hypothetical protein BCR33DRAFT_785562 [Rhizoclosmatium globosum]